MKKHNDSESAQRARNIHDVAADKRRGGLSQAWRKAARGARRGLCTAAAALSMAFGIAAGAQAQEVKPLHAAAVSAAAARPDVKRPDYAHSGQRLRAIEGRMKKADMGKALLQFAADSGIRIRMSNAKAMDDNPSDRFTVSGTYGDKLVLLNGDEKKDDEIMMTLAHELRHAWHDVVIHQGDMRLDATRMLIRDRMLEADVFAFEVHFAFEYEKATGLKLRLGDRARPCARPESSLCMLEGYARDRASGMEVPAAYGKLMERTLRHVHAEQYDEDFLKSQDETWQAVIDKPGTGLAWFGPGDEGLMPDADFAAALRRVATVGMKPGEGVSALSAWTDNDFLSLEKTGGKDVERALDPRIKKFDKARTGWNSFRNDLRQHPDIQPAPKAQPLPEAHPVIRDGARPTRPAA